MSQQQSQNVSNETVCHHILSKKTAGRSLYAKGCNGWRWRSLQINRWLHSLSSRKPPLTTSSYSRHQTALGAKARAIKSANLQMAAKHYRCLSKPVSAFSPKHSLRPRVAYHFLSEKQMHHSVPVSEIKRGISMGVKIWKVSLSGTRGVQFFFASFKLLNVPAPGGFCAARMDLLYYVNF